MDWSFARLIAPVVQLPPPRVEYRGGGILCGLAHSLLYIVMVWDSTEVVTNCFLRQQTQHYQHCSKCVAVSFTSPLASRIIRLYPVGIPREFPGFWRHPHSRAPAYVIPRCGVPSDIGAPRRLPSLCYRPTDISSDTQQQHCSIIATTQ